MSWPDFPTIAEMWERDARKAEARAEAAEACAADLGATVARVDALWKAQMKGNSHKGTANVFVSVDSILRALVGDEVS